MTGPDGGYYNPEEETRAEERRPFKAILDTGLTRTTTGARVFGVMKGVVDGGVNVPHSETRFPGYDKESETLNGEVHRERIFGLHVAKYMEKLQQEDPARYQAHFSRYVAKGITADKLEGMYREAHAEIRADPMKKKQKEGAKAKAPDYKPKSYRKRPRTLKDRKNTVRQKIQSLKNRMAQVA